jgi:sugar O-acyltransferase (sialic acid O-acetyltransferase NeuD family)
VSSPLIVVGCGGFGREVIQIVAAANRREHRWQVEGVVDDGPDRRALDHLAALGVRHLGPITELTSRQTSCQVVVAIGSPTTRARIVSQLSQLPVTFPTIVHPDATVAPDAELGAGTIVAPGARISTNVRIGTHVHIDQNATVGHDSLLADFVRINPLACVGGTVQVDCGAVIGAGAVVLQNLRVGAAATVGAAACVVRDVPEGAVVKGVPAR